MRLTKSINITLTVMTLMWANYNCEGRKKDAFLVS